MGEAITSGLFALTAAITAISYQYWQFRNQMKKNNEKEISDSKKRVISELIAYRFVLIGDRKNDPEPTMKFNAALSSIPIEFSENRNCIEKYRTIGNNFTADKYYGLIKILMDDVSLDANGIDIDLLKNVPSIKPKTT